MGNLSWGRVKGVENLQKNFLNIEIIQIFYRLKLKQNKMEEAILRPPNNSGQILRLEIKQKNIHTKKRKVKTWSPQEDDQLVKLYQQYPKKWGIIASLMQDRNQNQCLHRYRRLSQLGAHKKIWSAEEDQTILSLIKKVGKNWKLLAEIMGTKTGKQIRQRFINKLDPKIKTEEWTDEQDRLILKYYSEVGSRWSEISKKLTGRPQNKIKNRFYSYIQKNYDIRYVVVDKNQTTEEKNKKDGSDEVKQDSNTKENLSKVQMVQQNSLPERKCFKELTLNDKKQPNTRTLKPKDRLKPRYARFSERKYQQNIYEDENQESVQKIKSCYKDVNKEKVNKNTQQIPSIKELEDEFKIIGGQNLPQSKIQFLPGQNLNVYQEKDEIFDSNIQIGQKFYIKSLIRVEDQIGPAQNRYRSIRDLVSNNQIQNNENDLFYLSHN